MLGRNRVDNVRQRVGRNPVGPGAALGVGRLPVAGFGLDVYDRATGVINQQIVAFGQHQAKPLQGPENLGAVGIEKDGGGEIVALTQDFGDGKRVVDGGRERRQVLVVVDTDD